MSPDGIWRVAAGAVAAAACLLVWSLPAAGAVSTVKTLLDIRPTPEFPRHSEGDIIGLSGDRLGLVYTRFRGGSADSSQADLVLLTSSDGGATWSEPKVLVEGEGRQNVMSVSLLRERGGDLLLFYLVKNSISDCNLYVRRSPDDLETLSPPIRVTSRDGYHVVNNARVVQLASGRILVPAALHPNPDGTDRGWSRRAIPLCYYSDDAGRSWKLDQNKDATAPPGPETLQEPGVVQLDRWRVLMWHRTEQGTQYECISRDEGETWTKPVPGPLRSPNSPASIKRSPWSGKLLAVWNDHSGDHPFPAGRRVPLAVAVSHDNGQSWRRSIALEDDPAGMFCYISITFDASRALLSYTYSEPSNRGWWAMKVVELPREFIDSLSAQPAAATTRKL